MKNLQGGGCADLIDPNQALAIEPQWQVEGAEAAAGAEGLMHSPQQNFERKATPASKGLKCRPFSMAERLGPGGSHLSYAAHAGGGGLCW
jgi:hypothetical protein